MAKKKTAKKKTSAKKSVKKKSGKKKVAKKAAKKATKKAAKKAGKKKVALKKTAKKSGKKTASKKPASRAKSKAKKPAAKKRKKSPVAAVVATAPMAFAGDDEVTNDMPAVGSPAPQFSIAATGGDSIDLASFRNRSNVVLYFYPKDDTPGCTVEACAFRDDYNTYAGTDTVVLGVSPDDVESHGKFTNKFSLPFPLLADVGANLAKQYGVWVEKNMYGNKKMGVQRATFLIDKTGSIAAVWPKVKVEGHSQEILEKLRNLK